jgi:hypothetical protein
MQKSHTGKRLKKRNKLGLSQGDAAQPTAPVLDDIATLTAAIEVIEEALAKRRATLAPAKKAEVIALAYDILKGDSKGFKKATTMPEPPQG